MGEDIFRYAESIKIANVEIRPGERKCIELPAAQLYTQTPMNIQVHVVRGTEPGPCTFVTAAIHGDKINGVEIIRRLLESPAIRYPRDPYCRARCKCLRVHFAFSLPSGQERSKPLFSWKL